MSRISTTGYGHFKYIDAHTHAQFAAFDADRDAVIRRALEHGVGMVNVGTNYRTSEAAVRLTREYPEGIYAAVGLHPIHTAASHHDTSESGEDKKARDFSRGGEEFESARYQALAGDEKVVAIGECGLDYFHVSDREAKEKQKNLFIQHIQLAHEVKKPLMVHCRDAYKDLIDILTTNRQSLVPKRPGIAHFFSGTKEDAKRLLELGFYFTFGGVITFVRDYNEIIRLIPADRILSETDAPYVTPAPYRGKRNEPAYVISVVEQLAAIKRMNKEEMRQQILENTERALRIAP